MTTSGKTVLITGGGSGIGLALAKIFLKNKNTVIITGRKLKKLEKAKSENPALHIAQCDVRNAEEIQALKAKLDAEFGGIDVLVNNAGVFHEVDHKDESYPFEKHLQEIDIDFTGPIRMVHYFLPGLLKKEDAAIVNVSSGLAFIPFTLGPVYSATKAGIHSWTQSLRFQLSKTNVKVFELMPPVVDTEMVATLEGSPKMAPEKLAKEFFKGYSKDKLEITPGQSAQLKFMRRLAPAAIFKMLNKAS